MTESLDQRRHEKHADAAEGERKQVLRDLAAFTEELAYTFRRTEGFGGSLTPEHRPPDDPDAIPLALLRKFRRQLAKFVKDAQAADDRALLEQGRRRG